MASTASSVGSTDDATPLTWNVGIIGAGSAAEALVEALPAMWNVVVFERQRVGGECPFVACMPSKAMLHDAAARTTWRDAVDRRANIVEHLDDSGHADQLRGAGATLVRADAKIVDPHTVRAGGNDHHVEHIVLATGSHPIVPPIDGLDTLGDRLWTSDDAATTSDLPQRLVIIGGGVIGCELATAFAGFGVEVELIDSEPHAFPELTTEVGEVVDAALVASGVAVRRGTLLVRAELRPGASEGHDDRTVVVLTTEDGSRIEADQVLVATGVAPTIGGLGLESLGIDELVVDDTGRVDAPGSIWAIGDVAGFGQYTHLANHHGIVVADHLAGTGRRRFDDVVVSGCVFTDPPLFVVGPTRADLDGDDDVVWAEVGLNEIARSSTDQLGEGHLAVAARRSTGRLIAAHGVGARFDGLAAPLVIAIDGCVPVQRLAQSMQPFPTIGELLPVAFRELAECLETSAN